MTDNVALAIQHSYTDSINPEVSPPRPYPFSAAPIRSREIVISDEWEAACQQLLSKEKAQTRASHAWTAERPTSEKEGKHSPVLLVHFVSGGIVIKFEVFGPYFLSTKSIIRRDHVVSLREEVAASECGGILSTAPVATYSESNPPARSA
ncbi:hypothetical protein [Achromobacter marplatensis]